MEDNLFIISLAALSEAWTVLTSHLDFNNGSMSVPLTLTCLIKLVSSFISLLHVVEHFHEYLEKVLHAVLVFVLLAEADACPPW